MTQEDKDLLLKDLCSRLPYNLIVHVHDVIEYNTCLREEYLVRMKSDKITLKPYLRSMSSMTEEEKNTYDTLIICNAPWVVNDWLNVNHFDYRGLIPIGIVDSIFFRCL